MKHLLVLLCFLACFGCGDPGAEIINVTLTTGGNGDPVVTENVVVVVRDSFWVYDYATGNLSATAVNEIGQPSGVYKPADAEAVEAIKAYINK